MAIEVVLPRLNSYIINFIQTLKENGSSVIVITHREEIAAASDKASLMCEGAILRSGDPIEISEFFKNRCIPCDSRVSSTKGGLTMNQITLNTLSTEMAEISAAYTAAGGMLQSSVNMSLQVL